jgi:hypothetical protein
MGLGKSLTMLSNIVMTLGRARIFSQQDPEQELGQDPTFSDSGSTLIIVPSTCGSTLTQNFYCGSHFVSNSQPMDKTN